MFYGPNAPAGYVEVSFMVDALGHPYALGFTDSSNPRFHASAREAIARSKYTPATLDGLPVDSGRTRLFFFAWRSWVSPDITVNMREFDREMKDGNLQAAQATLGRLSGVDTLPEFLRYELARHGYLTATNASALEVLEPLANIVTLQAGSRSSPSRVRPYLVSLFRLQTEVGQYGNALRTADRILAGIDLPEDGAAEPAKPEEVARLAADRSIVEKIQAARAGILGMVTSEKPTVARGEIAEISNAWVYWPYRRSFAFADVSPTAPDSETLAEVQLRCERGYAKYRYEPGRRYDLRYRGACQLHVSGAPGTRFSLVER